MANWGKLNKEFDDKMDSLTNAEWLDWYVSRHPPCNNFTVDLKTTSATLCICGSDKIMHAYVKEV